MVPIKRERFLVIQFYKGSTSTRRGAYVIHCAIKEPFGDEVVGIELLLSNFFN